jgi:hypothetical protein
MRSNGPAAFFVVIARNATVSGSLLVVLSDFMALFVFRLHAPLRLEPRSDLY